MKTPKPPEFFNDVAREEWERVVSLLAARHLSNPLKEASLIGYCTAYANLIEAQKLIQKYGQFTKTQGGAVRLNPAVDAASRASATMRGFMRDLDLVNLGRLDGPGEEGVPVDTEAAGDLGGYFTDLGTLQ